MLANGRNIATGNSDDMCTVCGDGGELIICNRCPRAFHAGSIHVNATFALFINVKLQISIVSFFRALLLYKLLHSLRGLSFTDCLICL